MLSFCEVEAVQAMKQLVGPKFALVFIFLADITFADLSLCHRNTISFLINLLLLAL
jgi:hypothetical protein